MVANHTQMVLKPPNGTTTSGFGQRASLAQFGPRRFGPLVPLEGDREERQISLESWDSAIKKRCPIACTRHFPWVSSYTWSATRWYKYPKAWSFVLSKVSSGCNTLYWSAARGGLIASYCCLEGRKKQVWSDVISLCRTPLRSSFFPFCLVCFDYLEWCDEQLSGANLFAMFWIKHRRKVSFVSSLLISVSEKVFLGNAMFDPIFEYRTLTQYIYKYCDSVSKRRCAVIEALVGHFKDACGFDESDEEPSVWMWQIEASSRIFIAAIANGHLDWNSHSRYLSRYLTGCRCSTFASISFHPVHFRESIRACILLHTTWS